MQSSEWLDKNFRQVNPEKLWLWTLEFFLWMTKTSWEDNRDFHRLLQDQAISFCRTVGGLNGQRFWKILTIDGFQFLSSNAIGNFILPDRKLRFIGPSGRSIDYFVTWQLFTWQLELCHLAPGVFSPGTWQLELCHIAQPPGIFSPVTWHIFTWHLASNHLSTVSICKQPCRCWFFTPAGNKEGLSVPIYGWSCLTHWWLHPESLFAGQEPHDRQYGRRTNTFPWKSFCVRFES